MICALSLVKAEMQVLQISPQVKSAITLASTASLKQILQDVNGKFEVGTAYFPSITDEDQGAYPSAALLCGH